MQNTFLEQMDRQWSDNGLLVEKAIITLGDLISGEDVSLERLKECQTNLLRTLMTDTPSGIFYSAIAFAGGKL